MKVLLFTASYGDGHHTVGRALMEAFQRRGIDVVSLDSFRETNRFTAGVSELSYEISSKYFPWMYGASYRVTANLSVSHPLWQIFAWMSRKAALEAIKTHKPDVVLQLFPDHSLCTLIKTGKARPFIGVVLTDYSLHSRWFHRAVDAYYLPTDQLVDGAVRLSGGQASLVVTGIPVREEFSRDAGTRPVEQPYILFSTGGRGVFRDLTRTLKLARSVLPNYPIYVMCGRNERMYSVVERLCKSDSGIVPMGFQNNMSSWLRHAELAVMKSGGVTVTEALVSRCPMVLYRPYSGQEADNARYVERMGGGKIAQGLRQFRDALLYFSEKSHRDLARAACGRAASDAAADKMVTDLVSRFSGTSPHESDL